MALLPATVSAECRLQLLRLAEPFPEIDRRGFFERIAERLARVPPDGVGDGIVFQVGREVQSEMFKPPDVDWGTDPPKRSKRIGLKTRMRDAPALADQRRLGFLK
jgi:hypothetical protein